MQLELQMPAVVEKKKYAGMSPQKQEEYIEKKIVEILKMNPDGITIPDIVENTPFTRPTVIKHLERLASSRESYKIKRRNVTTFFPNGRVVHPEYIKKVENETGGVYRATLLNNAFGEFVYIEELNNQTLSGGSMLINTKNLSILVDLLNEIHNKLRSKNG